jgi:hypothetical protein
MATILTRTAKGSILTIAEMDANLNGLNNELAIAKDISQNTQNAGYTIALSDSGKHVLMFTSGVYTIPDSSVAFNIGAAVTFVNVSGGACTIAITTNTLLLAGPGTLGTRTLANNGIATALRISNGTWIISGVGLT